MPLMQGWWVAGICHLSLPISDHRGSGWTPTPVFQPPVWITCPRRAMSSCCCLAFTSSLPPHPLQVPVLKPMDLMVEVSPRRIFANGHTYHINSISVNSDCETYMSADDLRINLWHLAITDRSFSILHCGLAGASHRQGGFRWAAGLVWLAASWFGGGCIV